MKRNQILKQAADDMKKLMACMHAAWIGIYLHLLQSLLNRSRRWCTRSWMMIIIILIIIMVDDDSGREVVALHPGAQTRQVQASDWVRRTIIVDRGPQATLLKQIIYIYLYMCTHYFFLQI